MAKDTTTWFRHDCNAKDDTKCVLLIEQLGMEGYGIFWVLIEVLRDQPEYRYPISLLPALARRYNTTTEKLKTVVFSYDLFKIEGEDFFYSESLLERMNQYDLIRERLSENGRKGGLSKSLARLQQGQSKAIANSSERNRIERNRIEEKVISVKKATAFTPPTQEEVKNKMIEKEIDTARAELESFKFVSHYESNGWMVGKNKMKSWNGAVGTWLSNLNKFTSNGPKPITAGDGQPTSKQQQRQAAKQEYYNRGRENGGGLFGNGD